MGDSTAMTVEFLRARLLSERSVSRTARQRADQLAKRVVELEEQLRIVTVQRRKAEKAAAEVLSILEAQGFGDLSEVVDSSSEQDVIPCGLKGSNDTVKEDESSTTSRMDRSEVDDGYSGSEPEVSPSQGRSISWKGNSNSQDSVEKKNISQNRQRQRRSRSMYAVDSSPRHPLGKSCRKNKRKEMGCTVENGKADSHFNDVQEQEAAPQVGDIPNGLDNCPDISNGSSGNNEDKAYDLVTCSVDGQSKYSNTNPQENGISKHEQMEQALEKQAQLILLYQAEENSQREWEHKFNKNNCSTMEPTKQWKTEIACDSNEPKEDKATMLPDEILCPNKELNSCSVSTSGDLLDGLAADPTSNSLASKKCGSAKGLGALTISDGFSIPDESTQCGAHAAEVNTDGLANQSQRHNNSTETTPLESGTQDFEFPGQAILCRREKDNIQGLQDDNSDIVTNSSSNLQPPINGFVESPSRESLSLVQSSLRYSREQLQVQNQLHTPLLQNRNSGLEVLEALQRAKLSLKQELDRSTTQNQTTWTSSTSSHVSAVRLSDSLNIPIGSAGLFRLPTDPQPGSPLSDLSRPNYYNSSSSLDYLPYSDLGLDSSSQRTLGHYPDIGSRITPRMNNFGPWIGSGIIMPAYTSMYSSPSPDFQVARSSNNNLQKHYIDMKSEGLTGNQYSIFGVGRTSPDLGRN